MGTLVRSYKVLTSFGPQTPKTYVLLRGLVVDSLNKVAIGGEIYGLMSKKILFVVPVLLISMLSPSSILSIV
jgi:hypothetical protein